MDKHQGKSLRHGTIKYHDALTGTTIIHPDDGAPDLYCGKIARPPKNTLWLIDIKAMRAVEITDPDVIKVTRKMMR